MKKLARKLLLVSVILSSTQVISISGLGLSIFQIALIISFIVCIFGLFELQYIKRGLYIWFSITTAFSSLIAFIISSYPSWAKSYFLLGLLTALLCFFIPIYFEEKDLPQICKALIQSQYITIGFSIYSFYRFYFMGGIPNHISLIGGLYIDLEKEFFARGQAAGQIRLALPYSTPPVLSVVMAVCIVILLYDKEIYSKTKKWILVIAFSTILVLTGSRTGIIGLFLFLLLEASMYLTKNKRIPKWAFRVIMLSIFIAIITIKMGDNSAYFQKYINRFVKLFSGGELFKDRHFLVPLDGLIIWLSSAKRFIVGIGFGSSYNMMGAHTYLPPYFLNSFVTWIAERGIFGVYLISCLLYIVLECKKNKNKLNSSENSLINALCVALISCLFYEVLICYTVIIIIAASFVIVKKCTNILEEKQIEDNNGNYSNI